MTRYTLEPAEHPVFNEFDRHGLLLDLPRLEGERNDAYKQRLLDVLVHRADSTYLGLIYGITRELGMSITDTMTISPDVDGNGDFLLTMPAIVFKETKCYLYSDYGEGTILKTIDRFDPDGDGWTIGDLRDEINETGFFTATILDNLDPDLRSMTIFNQESVHTVPSEGISGAGIVVKLDNRNLVNGSVVIRSETLFNRVSTQIAIRNRGDFFIDHQAGIIYSAAAPGPSDAVRYQYVDSTMTAKSSPVIIHDLQSDDFKTKMFEQIEDEDGNSVNGLPTVLGADVINELLSAYPVSWGR